MTVSACKDRDLYTAWNYYGNVQCEGAVYNLACKEQNESDGQGITIHSGQESQFQNATRGFNNTQERRQGTSRRSRWDGVSTTIDIANWMSQRMEKFSHRRSYKGVSLDASSNDLCTHPLGVVEIGLKSIRPASTKCRRTSDQSSRESQEILFGASTSTGMTWLISPH